MNIQDPQKQDPKETTKAGLFTGISPEEIRFPEKVAYISHGVASYKKTQTGDAEIIGPITIESFKKTPQYALLAKQKAVSALLDDMESDVLLSPKNRVFIQASKTDKGFSDKKILLGAYTGNKPDSRIDITAIYDVESQALLKAKDDTAPVLIRIQPSFEGNLTQKEADQVVRQLKENRFGVTVGDEEAITGKSVMNSGGNSQISEVMTVKEFKQSAAYKLLEEQAAKTDQESVRKALDRLFERLDKAADGDKTRVLVQSIKATDGQIQPDKVIVGNYQANPENNQLNVDMVYVASTGRNLTMRLTDGKLASFIDVELGAKQGLTQYTVDKLSNTLSVPPFTKSKTAIASDALDVPNISLMEKASSADKKATLQVLLGGEGLEFLNEQQKKELNTQKYAATQDNQVLALVTEGEQRKLLIGNLINSKVEGVDIMVFTKSFNLNNNKTSNLEVPILLPFKGEGMTTQTDVDNMINAVRQATEKNEISLLRPKGNNPHFDTLLAKGPAASTDKDAFVTAPVTPLMPDKKLSVA